VVVKDRIYKDILVWEVNFPSDFNIEVDALYFELQDGTLFKDIQTRFESNDVIAKKKVLDLLDLDEIKKKIPDYTKIYIKIFKDIPGFKLWPHLDRIEHKGFIMINLIDNKNSTTFYDRENNKLFEGLNKKNTGVFHILHKKPFVKHGIENTSKEDRYTTIAFIK